MGMGILFLDGPAEFEIKRDIVYIHGSINGEDATMCLRVSDLPPSMASATAALRKWQAGRGKVIPLNGGKNGHHAAS